jgi:hypothetical protein
MATTWRAAAPSVLAEGGFDERLTVVEGNDLCYRRLRSTPRAKRDAGGS